MLRLLALPPERTLPLIYPRLFALGSLLTSLPDDLPFSELRLPEAVNRLSAAKLSEDGVFLQENGYEAYIQFGPRVPSELMMALLGACPCPWKFSGSRRSSHKSSANFDVSLMFSGS